MTKNKILLTGIGSYLPNKKVSNFDLSKIMDTSDEWITKRTGIKSRHYVNEHELTSDMGTEAAKNAINNAKIDIKDVDIIIVATTTPDKTFPSTASKIQQNLNSNAIAFDIQAVCAGFIYAICIGTSMLKDGFGKKCLIVGADSMSKILDWDDRSTSVLFGDGAGAVLLDNRESEDGWGILTSKIFTDGKYYNLLKTDGGVSENKSSGHIKMNGKEVFKHAVEKLCSSLNKALNECDLKIENLDWIIPHQANQRILDSVANKMKFDKTKIISTISQHGNTSAASIPLALDYSIKKGKVKNGNILALQAIGGGLAWGTSIVKIGHPNSKKKL